MTGSRIIGLLIILLGVVVVAVLVLGIRLRPSGQLLTIARPVGGTLWATGIRCGTRGADCSAKRPKGEMAELTAEADAGFTFVGYTGDCAPGGRTVMTTARTCGATFVPGVVNPGATQLLTIAPVPTGGTIEGVDILCGTKGSVCSANYPEGVPVELRPTPDSEFTFIEFVGDCAPLGRMQMTGPRICSATFSPTAEVSKVPVQPPKIARGRSSGPTTTPGQASDPVNPPPPPPPLPLSEKGTRAEGTHANVTVFFATDRERTSLNPLTYTSNRSDGALRFGQIDVHVPRLHELGKVERPAWYEFWKESPDKHFVIRRAVEQNSGDFYIGLRSAIGKSEGKQALIFIHGFNVTFESAVLRTAQIAYDLDFDGAPILYSWPSEGKFLRYPTDLNNNEWTVDHLKAFLKEVSEKSGATTIHIVAHSMGNRALMNALQRLAAIEPAAARQRFNQVAFTAPDIDADVFRQLAGSLRRLIARATLYASSRDRALEASKAYHKYQRAGDTVPSVVVVEGIDTIDVSAVDSEFLGHFYYGSNRSVLSDLFYVFQGLSPEKRATLRRASSTAGSYWAFQP